MSCSTWKVLLLQSYAKERGGFGSGRGVVIWVWINNKGPL